MACGGSGAPRGRFGTMGENLVIISPANLATLVGHLRGYQKCFLKIQNKYAANNAANFMTEMALFFRPLAG